VGKFIPERRCTVPLKHRASGDVQLAVIPERHALPEATEARVVLPLLFLHRDVPAFDKEPDTWTTVPHAAA
jgi:hypothetical protein